MGLKSAFSGLFSKGAPQASAGKQEPSPAPAQPPEKAKPVGLSGNRLPNLPGSDAELLAQIGRDVCAKLDANPAAFRIQMSKLDMFAINAFMSLEECQRMVELIDADVKPSLALDDGYGETHRTSETCRLSDENSFVREIEERISVLLGLELKNSETIQGQRYSEGQYFMVHNDYIAAGQSYSAVFAKEGGQRTWTAMVYLNKPEAGGGTHFPLGPVTVPPSPGVLLVWNNMDREGVPNRFSHHEGQKVEKGQKYVLTKWFREREWQGSEASDALRR